MPAPSAVVFGLCCQRWGGTGGFESTYVHGGIAGAGIRGAKSILTVITSPSITPSARDSTCAGSGATACLSSSMCYCVPHTVDACLQGCRVQGVCMLTFKGPCTSCTQRLHTSDSYNYICTFVGETRFAPCSNCCSSELSNKMMGTADLRCFHSAACAAQ